MYNIGESQDDIHQFRILVILANIEILALTLKNIFLLALTYFSIDHEVFLSLHSILVRRTLSCARTLLSYYAHWTLIIFFIRTQNKNIHHVFHSDLV